MEITILPEIVRSDIPSSPYWLCTECGGVLFASQIWDHLVYHYDKSENLTQN
jgi:hypothetical protein